MCIRDSNYIYDSMAGPYGYGSWDAIPAELREAYDTYTLSLIHI